MVKLKLFFSALCLIILTGCDGSNNHEHSYECNCSSVGLDRDKIDPSKIEESGQKDQITSDKKTDANTTQNVIIDVISDKNNTENNAIDVVLDINESNQTQPVFIIKQTTQTNSYDKFGNTILDLKDDGYYKKGVPLKYTKDANSSIVKDELTGLMWQDDEETATITRPWSTNDVLDENATEYCSKLELENYHNWRVPTRGELADIVNYGRYDPSIDAAFKHTGSKYYWSSTTYKINDLNVWGVDFFTGKLEPKNKNSNQFIRCVRGVEIKETNAGIKWHDDINGAEVSWHDAIDYCEELEIDGDRWRVPNINELKSIIDDTASNPAAKDNMLGKHYWSSTSYANNKAAAWFVDFYTAKISFNDKNGKKYVRCVKDIK